MGFEALASLDGLLSVEGTVMPLIVALDEIDILAFHSVVYDDYRLVLAGEAFSITYARASKSWFFTSPTSGMTCSVGPSIMHLLRSTMALKLVALENENWIHDFQLDPAVNTLRICLTLESGNKEEGK